MSDHLNAAAEVLEKGDFLHAAAVVRGAAISIQNQAARLAELEKRETFLEGEIQRMANQLLDDVQAIHGMGRERDAVIAERNELKATLAKAIEQDYCTMCGRMLEGGGR